VDPIDPSLEMLVIEIGKEDWDSDPGVGFGDPRPHLPGADDADATNLQMNGAAHERSSFLGFDWPSSLYDVEPATGMASPCASQIVSEGVFKVASDD
jgi:hypothetical protein